MSTKNNPGPRNYYAELGPDEEFVVFGSHDDTMPLVCEMWSIIRLQLIKAGIKPESDREQVAEMMNTAVRARIQQRELAHKEERASMKFDANGYPLTGPHAKKANNTTSGAND